MSTFFGSPTNVPLGGLVLVTRGIDPIPLQIIRHLLDLGYRVRATTFATDNAAWLNHLFAHDLANGAFQHLVLYGSPLDPGVLQEALGGVHAVVHTPLLRSDLVRPDDCARCAVQSVRAMLATAAAVPSLCAFVLTSSMLAATPLVPLWGGRVTRWTWNTWDVFLARREGDNPYRSAVAGLVAAEQALWS